MTKFSYFLLCLLMGTVSLLKAQPQAVNYHANDRFEQMGTALPTPNSYRTASGAPGKDYWQNRVDYDIKAELDDEKRTLIGTEVMTYFNNSPDELSYVWVQLDQNTFEHKATGNITRNNAINEKGMSSMMLQMALSPDYGYGYKITAVKDPKTNKTLRYIINGTMMRVDLPAPIRKGQSASIQIDWNFKITDAKKVRGRSGFEEFRDGNCVYEMAQWFPRACVYDDVTGWQHKQFLGQGEFTLPFGNYKVAVTVPNDHILGATGELQNPTQVLTTEQIRRLDQARKITDKPVLIVTQDEATKNESSKPTGKKTWIFKADNVRDFAFATSRKFIWDGLNVNLNGRNILCMSFYPKEANPLWGQYSTQLVAHTVRTYSRFTFDYPYPVAQSVHGPVGGMEYPMMSFNGARPEPDGTYSEGTKNFLIQVVIHEVGHNWFPMIVNSDERQWSWMDEGMNSFLEYLTTKEWDRNLGDEVAEPQNIVEYMRTEPSKQVPIMSSSDNIIPNTFGPNAYTKPATGLNILRETIMGRELFDYAFKE
ncbi:MAG: M1 family metallopeptidase, partial [Runella sp.]